MKGKSIFILSVILSLVLVTGVSAQFVSDSQAEAYRNKLMSEKFWIWERADYWSEAYHFQDIFYNYWNVPEAEFVFNGSWFLSIENRRCYLVLDRTKNIQIFFEGNVLVMMDGNIRKEFYPINELRKRQEWFPKPITHYTTSGIVRGLLILDGEISFTFLDKANEKFPGIYVSPGFGISQRFTTYIGPSGFNGLVARLRIAEALNKDITVEIGNGYPPGQVIIDSVTFTDGTVYILN